MCLMGSNPGERLPKVEIGGKLEVNFCLSKRMMGGRLNGVIA